MLDIRLAHFLPLVSFLLFSLNSWAEDEVLFKQSIRLYNAGNYQQSCQLLSELLEKDKTDARYWLNFGNCSFMQKQYKIALQSFTNETLQKSPLSVVAKIYASKALKSMGRLNEALDLNQNILNEEVPKNLKILAEQDREKWLAIKDAQDQAYNFYTKDNWKQTLEVLQKQRVEDLSLEARILLCLTYVKTEDFQESQNLSEELLKLDYLTEEEMKQIKVISIDSSGNKTEAVNWVYIDISTGQNNNIYFENRTLNPMSSQFLKLYLGAGHSFNSSSRWKPKIHYNFNYDEPAKDKSLRTMINNLQLDLEANSEQQQIRGGIFASHQIWDNTTVSRNFGINTNLWFTQSYFDYGAYAEIYEQVSLNKDFSYLSGRGYSIRAFVGSWYKNLYAQIYVQGGADRSGDILYSNGALLPGDHSFNSVGTRITLKIFENLILNVGLNSTKRNYKTLSLPTLKKRQDEENSQFIRVIFNLNAHQSVYTQYESTSNSSTLNAADVTDKNYNSSVVQLGYSWDVLK